jgi:hypothetical protein
MCSAQRSVLLAGLIVCSLLAFGLAPTVRADSVTFTIDAAGAGISASGTFTTDPLSGGSYQITSVTGLLNGQSMSLLPLGTYGGPSDNLLLASAPYVDFGGIAFAAGGKDYDLFGQSGTAFLCVVPPGQCLAAAPPYAYPAEFTWTDTTTGASNVPEPSASLLLSVGLGLVSVLGLKRRVIGN